MNDNFSSPILTIICIVYNHDEYLRQALEGFINQETKFKYEILIHDDASTDGSVEIIKEYQGKYPDRIRTILQKENQHSKGVRIFDIISKEVKSKYIALCEGDDYWSSNRKIERQIDFLEDNCEYSGSTHNTIIIGDNGLQVGKMCEWGEDRDITELDSMLFFPHTSSYILRNPWIVNDLERREFAKYLMGWDKNFAIYMIKTGKVRYFKEEYSCYRCIRQRGTSVSCMETQLNMTKERVASEYDLYNQLKAYDMLGKKKSFYCDHYYQNVYLYSIKKMMKNPSCKNMILIIYGIKESPYTFRTFFGYLLRKIINKARFGKGQNEWT